MDPPAATGPISATCAGFDVKRVHLQPENEELEIRRDGDAVVVDVPPLEVHSMVVAELN